MRLLIAALMLAAGCHTPAGEEGVHANAPSAPSAPSAQAAPSDPPPPQKLAEVAAGFGVTMQGGFRWQELDREKTRFDWSGRSPDGHEARWSFWLKGEDLKQARPFLPQLVASAAANLTTGRACDPFDQPAEIAAMVGADRVITVCFEPADFVTEEFRSGVLHGLVRGDVLVIVIVLANDRTGVIPLPDAIGGQFAR